jgi:hypothetical protein
VGGARLIVAAPSSVNERTARLRLVADPADATSLTELGVAAAGRERSGELLSWLTRAVAVAPTVESYQLNLAYGLLQARVWERAAKALRSVLVQRPGDGLVLYNLGALSLRLGRFEPAARFSGRAAAIDSDHADTRYNQAMALLGLGEWEQGWALYEWRWFAPSFTTPLRPQASPPWDGQRRPDASLLILAEQGSGDSLQFIRYAALAARYVGKVTFICHPLLVSLLRRTDGVAEVVAEPGPPPPADFHASLLSLPRLLGCAAPLVPPAPYLIADSAKTAHWRDRLAALPAPRVGLCWRGNPRFVDDALRSPGRRPLLPITETSGITFVNLTKTPTDDDDGPSLFDPTADLIDFDDTAALIAALDLVITSDTAIAHLSAGLGRPTWLMLSVASDWRWSTHETATSWYPTMRLFRQHRLGDWSGVLDRLIPALHAWRRVAGENRRTGHGHTPS